MRLPVFSGAMEKKDGRSGEGSRERGVGGGEKERALRVARGFSACAENGRPNVDRLEARGARYPVICLSTNHFGRRRGTTIFRGAL